MAVRSFSISRPKSSAVNAPAGSLSSRSVVTGQQYSSPEERKAADVQARATASEALARGSAPPQPASGGIYTSSLPGSVRSPQVESLRQQAQQERAMGNQQEAALIDRQAAEEARREGQKKFAEREAVFSKPTAIGQPERVSARTVLATRNIPFQQVGGVTQTNVPVDTSRVVTSASPGFAGKAATIPELNVTTGVKAVTARAGQFKPGGNITTVEARSPNIFTTPPLEEQRPQGVSIPPPAPEAIVPEVSVKEKATLYAEEQLKKYDVARAKLSSYGKLNEAQRKILLKQYETEYITRVGREEKLAGIEAKGGYKALSTKERLERIKLKTQIAAATPEVRETITPGLFAIPTAIALLPAVAVPVVAAWGAVDIPLAVSSAVKEIKAGEDPLHVLFKTTPRVALDIWAVRGVPLGKTITEAPFAKVNKVITDIKSVSPFKIVEPTGPEAFVSLKFGQVPKGPSTTEGIAWSSKIGKPIIAAKWERRIKGFEMEGQKPREVKIKRVNEGRVQEKQITPKPKESIEQIKVQEAKTKELITQKPKGISKVLGKEPSKFGSLTLVGSRLPKINEARLPTKIREGGVPVVREPSVPKLTTPEIFRDLEKLPPSKIIERPKTPVEKITERSVTERPVEKVPEEGWRVPGLPDFGRHEPGFGGVPRYDARGSFAGTREYKVIAPQAYKQLISGSSKAYLKRKRF